MVHIQAVEITSCTNNRLGHNGVVLLQTPLLAQLRCVITNAEHEHDAKSKAQLGCVITTVESKHVARSKDTSDGVFIFWDRYCSVSWPDYQCTSYSAPFLNEMLQSIPECFETLLEGWFWKKIS